MSSIMTQGIAPSGSDGRKLILKLLKDGAGEIKVLACEVIGPSFTNRTLFHENSEIHQVLAPDIAKSLVERLKSIGQQHCVIALPEFVVELPGLTLASIHMMVSKMRNGVQKVMVRFNTFLGSLNKVIRPKIGFESPTVTDHEKLAVEVLSDIALPLLNICRVPDIDRGKAHHQIMQMHRNLSDRADEISFYIELIKRFSVTNPDQAYRPRAIPRPDGSDMIALSKDGMN